MSPPRVRAAFLFYAAIQFVVLTAIAMKTFGGGSIADPYSHGYHFTGNFFSDLGATHGWAGQDNHVSSLLFAVALTTIGVAFIAFAGAWRAFAFGAGRARAAGIVAQLCGTLSGACFVAVALAPVDRHLNLHNGCVVAAFALLLGYAACMTLLWWKNGATRVQVVASVSYLVLVAAYVAIVLHAVRVGVTTDRGRWLMIVSQKAIVYASMVYVAFVTFVSSRAKPRG